MHGLLYLDLGNFLWALFILAGGMHIRHLAVIRGKADKHTRTKWRGIHTQIRIQYNNDQQDSSGVSAGLGQHSAMKGRNNEADFFFFLFRWKLNKN